MTLKWEQVNHCRGRLTLLDNEDQGWEIFRSFIQQKFNEHLLCARPLGDAEQVAYPPLLHPADITN